MSDIFIDVSITLMFIGAHSCILTYFIASLFQSILIWTHWSKTYINAPWHKYSSSGLPYNLKHNNKPTICFCLKLFCKQECTSKNYRCRKCLFAKCLNILVGTKNQIRYVTFKNFDVKVEFKVISRRYCATYNSV